MAAESQVRVLLTQSIAGALTALPRDKQAAVRDRVGGQVFTELEGQLPVAWGPMSRHMAISDAVRDIAGSRELVKVFRTSMLQSWDRPLLRGLVQTTTHLLGASPASLLRQCERTYVHITRDLGAMRGEGAGNSGRAELRGFPAKAYRFACYVEGLQGCLESILPLFKLQGEVTVLDVDAARGDVSYAMRW